jgi:hypothetical protein
MCWRVRRKRRDFSSSDPNQPNQRRSGKFTKLRGRSKPEPVFSLKDTQLDLIASRSSGIRALQIVTQSPQADRSQLHSTALPDPFQDSPNTGHSSASGLNRSNMLEDNATLRSPLEPALDRGAPARYSVVPPLPSQDGFRQYTSAMATQPVPLEHPNSTRSTARGPLILHDALPTNGQEAGANEVPDLKRETLAHLGEVGSTALASSGLIARPSAASAPIGRRRRREGDELDYMVHRDAGRIEQPPARTQRVVELPPRYEELDWEAERENRPDEDDGDEREDSGARQQSGADASEERETERSRRARSPSRLRQ